MEIKKNKQKKIKNLDAEEREGRRKRDAVERERKEREPKKEGIGVRGN
jgi:hypothetical protein